MLPKIKYPVYVLELPSTGKKIKYRGYNVAEEKILLTTFETKDIKIITDNIVEIIKACTFGEVDIKLLTPYDIEFLFLQLRSKSVSNLISMSFKNNNCSNEECPKNVKFNINLDEVQVQIKNDEGDFIPFNLKDSKSNRIIKINDSLSIKLRHPTLENILDSDTVLDPIEKIYYLTIKCIDSVIEDDTVFNDFTEEEIVEFFNSLMTKHKDEIFEFVSSIPRIRYTQKYICPKCGYIEDIKFEGLEDFFG